MTDSRTTGPLAGLKVVELHAIGPVPFAGQLLRGLGAEVQRISPPADPGLGVGMDPRFDVSNHGKAPLAIDLKDAEGRRRARETIDAADVLLEGFRPGVLERLGLAPETLLAANPRLVIGRLSGWGTRGPLAERAGHDINYLAIAGVLNAIGRGDSPVPPLNLVADYGGGAMHLVVGVLASLVRRGIDGRGGVVESSILAGSVGLSPIFHGLLAAGAWTLQREANLLDGGAPFYRTYATSDGRFVAVGAIEPKFYALLLKVTGLEGEIDPARQLDRASWPATTARFAARFAERTRDEWARASEGVDACLSPVLDFVEAAAHPHNRANGYFRDDPFPQPDRTISFPR
ncbi:MAG TPA: CaiB/BaiF CoA-transferase family protein [Burkholderiaceae bacterium]|nr:CaiB/BaiF CoA-transferase family protein [Burkholderiaceae bacterium]